MPNEIDTLPKGGTETDTALPQNETAQEYTYYDPDDDQDTVEDHSATSEGEPAPDEQASDEVPASDDEQSDDAEPKAEGDDKEAEKGALVVLPTGEKLSLEEVTKGFMRQQDYTRKTQAVAETRKQLETTAQQLQAVQTAFVDYLSQYVPPAPDAALAHTNPAEYVAQKAAHEAAIARVSQIAELGRQAQGVAKQVDQTAHKEILEREFGMLTERIPALKDPKAREKFREGTFAAAREFGFTDEELSLATDHRLFLLADAAREGIAARKAREAAKQKVAAVPPVTAPNKRAAPAAKPGNREAMDRLRRTGSIRDAMAIDFD